MAEITIEEFETLKMDHETLKGRFNDLCVILEDVGLKQKIDFEGLQVAAEYSEEDYSDIPVDVGSTTDEDVDPILPDDDEETKKVLDI